MRRAIPCLAAATALACALAATPALAGQVVWLRAAGSSGGAIWAANDDGTYPHRLVAAGSAPLATQYPGGTLADPEVFQNGGSTVLFTVTEGAFAAAPGGTAACAAPCANVVALAAGALSSPLPPAPATGAAFATQPRLAAGGQIVTQYALYPDATPASLGSAATQGIFSSPAGAPAFGLPWADTGTEATPLRADPAPDPASSSLVAWVENQDPPCTKFALNGAAVCQYAIHVASATAASPPIAIYDDEAPPGSGPSSLSWSSDGRTLLIVDDQPPNDGIYSVPASTNVPAAAKEVTEVIAEPPGWTFGQARFAGSRIVFDARGEGRSTPNTSDIYSISATCDSGTCQFPEDATNLTHDAAADNLAPAWTSAAAPLAALGAAPAPGAPAKLDAARILSRTVSPRTGVSFEVTLSAAGSVSVSISRHGHTIGSTTRHLPAGASTFAITKAGGHPLTLGTDVAKLRVGSSPAVRFSATFTVASPPAPKPAHPRRRAR